jgi:regulator of RNase E activity RraA
MSTGASGAAPGALNAELLARLRQLDTPTVANAIEFTGVRLRNEGYMDATVRCLFPELAPLLGYALTLRVRTSDPPMQGRRYVENLDWADELLALPVPRVLVVEDVGGGPGSGALVGGVHASIYAALGCAGVVTNGAVRDLPAVRALGFHAFASYVAVSHAYAHIVEVGAPVTVAGLEVSTGDLLHADQHGVLSVPLSVAARLPAIAARREAEERKVVDFCSSQAFTLAGLRRLLQQIQNPDPSAP